MRNLYSLLLFIGIVLGTITISCTNNESSDAPVITGVRMLDPQHADSLFNEGVAGQMIVLVGENLATTYEIYINDQRVSFQGPYVTDTHIILTIPSSIKLTGVDPSLKNEIRVHTRNGVVTYPFHINAGKCQISAMKANYPVDAGDEVVLVGENFIDIESVAYVDQLSDDGKEDDREWWEIADETKSKAASQDIRRIEISDYWVENQATELHLRLPDGMADCGWILVTTHTNTQNVILYKNATKSTITGINSDMPVLGSTVRIYGTGFIGVMSISFGDGEIVIPASKLKISEDADIIEFTMPDIPTKGKTLKLANVAGDVTIPFYDTSMLMFDLDNLGTLDWGGAKQIAGDGANPPYVTSGKCAGINGDIVGPNYWWGDGRMAFKNMVIPESIPADTPLDKIEIRYEGYYMTLFDYTRVTVSFGNFGLSVDEKPKSVLNGEIIQNEWASYHIPATILSKNSSTWGELVNEIVLPNFVFHAVSNSTNNTEHIQFYVDNIRFYVKPENK